MKFSLPPKSVLSPFVSVAFAVIAVTGVLLFFHVKNGPIMVLHEWFGWLFVVAGAVHLVLNLRPLLSYFRVNSARWALAVAMALVVSMIAIGLGHEGHEGPHGEGRGAGQGQVRGGESE